MASSSQKETYSHELSHSGTTKSSCKKRSQQPPNFIQKLMHRNPYFLPLNMYLPSSKCFVVSLIMIIYFTETFKMINECDPKISTWGGDGDVFVIKDQKVFETEVLPKYFNHKNFSSFARQLNFYNFRKIRSEPIRNADYDEITAKYVIFHNENFCRGRPDLLTEVKRSKRNLLSEDQQKEVDDLKIKVNQLQAQVSTMIEEFEGKIAAISSEFEREIKHLLEQVEHFKPEILHTNSRFTQGQDQSHTEVDDNYLEPFDFVKTPKDDDDFVNSIMQNSDSNRKQMINSCGAPEAYTSAMMQSPPHGAPELEQRYGNAQALESRLQAETSMNDSYQEASVNMQEYSKDSSQDYDKVV